MIWKEETKLYLLSADMISYIDKTNKYTPKLELPQRLSG